MKRPNQGVLWRSLGIGLVALGLAYTGAEGQEGREVSPSFGIDVEGSVRAFYADRPTGAKALPPGIRRNLARGKALPPGIAKTRAPAALVSTLAIPNGFEVVEVGLDVLLVETATAVVHDILMDVIR